MADKITPPKGKTILDATCGSRSIWFDKTYPGAIYMDKRVLHDALIWKNNNGPTECRITIEPDIVADFTDIPYADDSFSMVVFDPPHLIRLGESSWLAKKYGKLDRETWRETLRDGFRECMRVLKPGVILVFKWSESNIPAADLWEAIGARPLFGHRSGKRSTTFWGIFMKEKENTNG